MCSNLAGFLINIIAFRFVLGVMLCMYTQFSTLQYFKLVQNDKNSFEKPFTIRINMVQTQNSLLLWWLLGKFCI